MARLPRGVVALGLVSLCMDMSSEAIHAILPLYLIGTLGASALVLGLIEGLGEADRAGQLRRGSVEEGLRRDLNGGLVTEPGDEVLDPAVGHERNRRAVAGRQRGIPPVARLDVRHGGADQARGVRRDLAASLRGQGGATRHTP